jgi:hypothetical protein
MRRGTSLLLVLTLSVLGAVTATHAAMLGHLAAAKHHKKSPPHKLHGLSAPRLVAPANGARVQQLPALMWSAVGGASEYEYQVAADPHFHSIVLGSGPGRGTSTTHNLAAALGQSLPDGSYYWRVRGLTASKEPGPWSATRAIGKDTEAPRLLAPANGSAISWPAVPLVLSWTAVPGATEYIVTIATDERLSNNVLGTPSFPQKTIGTVFALPTTLHAGPYYWAITPLDAEGHEGTRSGVGHFTWSWPTSTTLNPVANLNPEAGPFDDPQFSWQPIAGAAKYEVEVNSAVEFPVGSKWCCTDRVTGTSLSPAETLANNTYYWRIRGVDASGNAGEWNPPCPPPQASCSGTPFTKAFDAVSPSVPSLTLTDVSGNPVPAGAHTNTPIVTWKPVPGAANYEVQVARLSEVGCEWNNPERNKKQTVETAALGWTPLAELEGHIGPSAWPSPRARGELSQSGAPGVPFCVRVLARSDHDAQGHQVTSEWTYLGGGNGHAAFYYESPPPAGTPAPQFEMPAGAYVLPQPGSNQTYTPLFTWQRVPGATSYYVVIARDPGFTNVIDVASTVVPAYAPPEGGEEPLDDETTGAGFYWAVIPVRNSVAPSAPPNEDNPQGFFKSSVAPTPMTPINETVVSGQPTFRWTPAPGALNYTLQVSEDPTFGKPIDNVRTDSTAYTSSSTYPEDVTLYWRVRANDTNSHTEGLHWSEVQRFRRRLPVPHPSNANPTSGQAIPVLSWKPVPGAIAYEVHIQEPSGTTKDFTVDSTAFTPTESFGTGVWHWEVRAAFPTNGFATVSSGFSPEQEFVHTLAPPGAAAGTKSAGRTVISWNPDPYVKEFQVEVATSDTFSFSSTIESRRVEGSNWAPDIDFTKPANKGTLYWRVAGVERGGNFGPYAEGRFAPPRPTSHCKVVKVKVKVGHKTKTVKKCLKPKGKHH